MPTALVRGTEVIVLSADLLLAVNEEDIISGQFKKKVLSVILTMKM